MYFYISVVRQLSLYKLQLSSFFLGFTNIGCHICGSYYYYSNYMYNS